MLISFLFLHRTLKGYAEQAYLSLTPRKGSATVRGRTIPQLRGRLTLTTSSSSLITQYCSTRLVVTSFDGVPTSRRVEYCCVTRGHHLTRAFGTTHGTHSPRVPRATHTTTHQAAQAHTQSAGPGLANEEAKGIASSGPVAGTAVVLGAPLVGTAHAQ